MIDPKIMNANYAMKLYDKTIERDIFIRGEDALSLESFLKITAELTINYNL